MTTPPPKNFFKTSLPEKKVVMLSPLNLTMVTKETAFNSLSALVQENYEVRDPNSSLGPAVSDIISEKPFHSSTVHFLHL